ncbi:uncharacterized protein LOC129293905 isoform X2 [Prosopis cineraria]|uniref:uncharacterized protein LOC129293905 isoform X2 n=1 Tax=Prosopis cineraria TaxID=364024 RepID=UPI00240F87C7|nr:uncharacterized protein LOC129293905 isoform X2 [Prosopis cineraria]
MCVQYFIYMYVFRVHHLGIGMMRRWILGLAIVCVCIFWRSFGINGDEYEPQTQTGGADPAQIVARALLCFNDKYIYKSCEESWRLNEAGNLKVPKDKTEEFCEGPCLSETYLVLSCIDDIFINFVFYNRATIQDIKDTVQAGCGYGPQRGNFDVEKQIQAEENRAEKASSHVLLLGLAFLIMGRGLFL